jgi:ADP-ribosyl-[dinitrogen reductase] hydrolase
MTSIDNIINSLKGTFFGCAVGDAFGASNEFAHIRYPMNEPHITKMEYVTHFKLPAGSWTDDTSMMLCLAESICDYSYFDHRTAMKYYLKWLSEGYNSVTDYAFDVGCTVRRAIIEYRNKGYLPARTVEEYCQSNGCLMRLAPVPMFYSNNCEEAARMSGESALTTHAHPVCVRTTELFGWLIAAAIGGDSYSKRTKDELLHFTGAPGYLLDITPKIGYPDISSLKSIVTGEYLLKSHRDLDSTGYVIAGLETALWAFAHTDSFRDGLILVVNLGGDTDTIGAIYGMLAGAYYGYDAIPGEWLLSLQGKDKLERVWNMFLPHCIEQHKLSSNEELNEYSTW